MVPFDELFQVPPLEAYHRVILAKDFVDNFAPQYWPLSKRKAFCHKIEEKPCTVDQDFFREFWDYVGVPTFPAPKVLWAFGTSSMQHPHGKKGMLSYPLTEVNKFSDMGVRQTNSPRTVCQLAHTVSQ